MDAMRYKSASPNTSDNNWRNVCLIYSYDAHASQMIRCRPAECVDEVRGEFESLCALAGAACSMLPRSSRLNT